MNSMAKRWTKPVAAVAADHRKKPPAMTQLTLKRSTSQPETSCMKA